MLIRSILSTITASALLLAFSGCATTGTWEVNGKCSGLPRNPNCEIGGKIGGTWGGSNKLTTLAQKISSFSVIPDAAQFALNISGSTIAYPLTGSAILTLRNADTDSIVASKSFNWYRSGNTIKLSDPDTVNAWALSAGSSANELTYKLTPFPLSSGYGQQTVSVQSVYEGSVTAASTTTYYRCSPYPSPYACASN